MTKAYFTEDQKLVQPVGREPYYWNLNTMYSLEHAFNEKGYEVKANLRHDNNGKLHNAFIVERELISFFIEALFQCRIIVEVEAVGKGKANIIFVCDNPLTEIKQVIRRIPKLEGGIL